MNSNRFLEHFYIDENIVDHFLETSLNISFSMDSFNSLISFKIVLNIWNGFEVSGQKSSLD